MFGSHGMIYVTCLDRNGNKAKVIPEEAEKRRALFWELLYLDARLVSLIALWPVLPPILTTKVSFSGETTVVESQLRGLSSSVVWTK